MKIFYTTDGVNSWAAGTFYSKDALLKEGGNNIKFVAYKASEVDNLKVGVNVQVNKFTITLLKEGTSDKMKDNGPSLDNIFDKFITFKF